MRRLFPFLLILALATACGSGGRAHTDAAGVGGSDGLSASVGASAPGSKEDPKVAASQAAAAKSIAASSHHTMEATATTVPSASLSFAVAYSDNNFIPDFTYVPTFQNTSGSFTWRWILRPTTPSGQAVLVVVAAKGKKGASYQIPFRVASQC
jgi:hypothetical protein